jgi:molybdopterin-binding protein
MGEIYARWIYTDSVIYADSVTNTTTYPYGVTDWASQTTSATWDGTRVYWVPSNGPFRSVVAYLYPSAKNRAKNRIQEIIQSRMSPAIHVRSGIGHSLSSSEQKARETLALVVGKREFRRFLKHGFVSVRNAISGRTYQIFSGTIMTRVYEAGKCIQRLCVVLPYKYPPTDSVIVRALMAWNNEEELWRLSHKHMPLGDRLASSPDKRSLQEIFKDLKLAS